MQVIDSLVAELDEFRNLNRIEEEHQVQLLQQVSASCNENDNKQAQLRQFTYDLESSETVNFAVQRDIDVLKSELSHNQ